MDKPIIRVWQTDSLGLIIFKNTGVRISNQTGGYACNQPEVEGIYIPLRTQAQDIEEFFVSKLAGDGSFPLNESVADFIDEYLQRDGNTCFLRVDRTRLTESHEAWVYVDITPPKGDNRSSLIEGFGNSKGVITWPNSD